MDPGSAKYKNSIGICYFWLGKYRLAREYFEKSLDLNIKANGKNDSRVATSWNNLGGVYYSKDQYEKAIENYKKALPIYEKFLGKEHPYTKGCRENLEMAQEKLAEKVRRSADR